MFVPPKNRYRLYIDETGTQTLKAAHSDRYLCLMGVIMRQDVHDGPVTAALGELKHKFFGHTPKNPVILHRRDMVRAQAPFERLHADEKFKVEFEAAWLDLIGAAPFLALAGAIDKIAHKDKYKVWQHDPYHYCLEVLVERFVRWCARHRFVGDVLIESRDKGADKRLKAAYSHLYRHGNSNVSAKLVQRILLSRDIKFGRKVDDIAGHQFADSFAHPCLRYLRTQKCGEEPVEDFGSRIVAKLIENRLARNPKTRVIEGWGLKWLPE